MSNRTAYFYDPDVGNFHYGKINLCLLADVANQWSHLQMLTVYFYKWEAFDRFDLKLVTVMPKHQAVLYSMNQKSKNKKKLLLCISSNLIEYNIH